MSILELDGIAGLADSMPGAELVLPYDADQEEWLAVRRTGIGGSDALACLGLHPWASPYTVWADKRGLLPPIDDNEAMLWGRLLEPVIAEEFTRRTGIETWTCGTLRSRERSWQLVNLDRLTGDDGILEIKSTSLYRAADWDDDQIADAAEAQIQHGLAVTGKAHGWAAVLIGGQRMEIRYAERNDKLISLLNEAEEELWELVVSGDAPALDGSDATLSALAHLYPHGNGVGIDIDDATADALRTYVNYNQQLKTLTEAKDAIKATVCGLLGSALSGSHNGLEVVTWKNTGTFNEAAFTADYPELAAEFTVKVERLDTKALQSARPDLYAAYRGRRFLPTKKGLL